MKANENLPHRVCEREGDGDGSWAFFYPPGRCCCSCVKKIISNEKNMNVKKNTYGPRDVVDISWALLFFCILHHTAVCITLCRLLLPRHRCGGLVLVIVVVFRSLHPDVVAGKK